MLLISLAPLIIAGLVIIFLLKEPVLFLVAVVLIFALIVVAVQHQKSVSRELYSSTPEDWMSRAGFYDGPFDNTGLPGAASFEKQHSRAGGMLGVRLVVTNYGLSFGPAGHSGSPLMVPFSEVRVVDLIEGTHPHKLLTTRPVAAQRGQVVVTTNQGQIAKFSGIPIAGIQAALEDRGATIDGVRN